MPLSGQVGRLPASAAAREALPFFVFWWQPIRTCRSQAIGVLGFAIISLVSLRFPSGSDGNGWQFADKHRDSIMMANVAVNWRIRREVQIVYRCSLLIILCANDCD